MVVSTLAPQAPFHRVTLTAAAINRARCIAFVISGEDKAGPIREVLEGDYQPRKYPAQLVKPHGDLYWYLDEAAASKLEKARSS